MFELLQRFWWLLILLLAPWLTGCSYLTQGVDSTELAKAAFSRGQVSQGVVSGDLFGNPALADKLIVFPNAPDKNVDFATRTWDSNGNLISHTTLKTDRQAVLENAFAGMLDVDAAKALRDQQVEQRAWDRAMQIADFVKETVGPQNVQAGQDALTQLIAIRMLEADRAASAPPGPSKLDKLERILELLDERLPAPPPE